MMLSSVSPPLSVTKSSLEEMLESIKRRDEQPKDIVPALPVRPLSKARLPSMRRSLPLSFKVKEGGSDGNDYMVMSGLKEKEGKKRERKLSKEDRDLCFEGNMFGNKKMVNVKVVPLSESRHSEGGNELKNDLKLFGVHLDSSLLSEESKSGENVDCVLKKEFPVWCQLPNDEWKAGKIESASPIEALVFLSDGSVGVVTVPRGNVLPANPHILEGIDDLVQLSFVNEPSVLHNLQSRYYDDKIYTKAGQILVAVNPFKDAHQKEFLVGQKHMAPHVYTTAETAFNEMMRGEENQSIIVSGESGSGKTETAKIAIQYLASRGGDTKMEYKFLQTNCLLEAFGNAKTSRNHNSSRFGKLIEIYFGTSGKVCGAKIETLPIEKSRVVKRAKGDRSYHVFYQLCSGAPSLLKERLHLRMPGEYDYLKQSNCLTIDDLDDSQRFHMLMEAFETVQISKDDQEDVFAMLSAVLWLGNISFKIIDNANHVEVNADEAVTTASKLIGCNVQDLMSTLSTRYSQAGKGSLFEKLTLPQAIGKRDALAQSLYSGLFDWLLEKINKSLEVDKRKAWRSISILDLHGFESFQKNSFEQLRVNYANERLQQHFIRHFLKLEQEEYTLEGIDWKRVEFEDNQECLNLFEQKPCGLLSLLDEEQSFLDEESNPEQATDVALANRLTRLFNSSPCFIAKRDGAFSISHYAGEVLYDTSGLLEKNRIPLQFDSIQLLSSRTYQLPQLFASHLLKSSQFPMSSYLGISVTDSLKESVGETFKDQLFTLLQRLENTKPHYICCIKPNSKQFPGVFEKDLVLQQLRSCRILEVVRISRSGFPNRITHEEFARRYGFQHFGNGVSHGPLDMSVFILQKFNIHPDMYRVGYNKLLFRPGQVAMLEDKRKRMLQCIINVQKCFRGHLARLRFLELMKRITTPQSSERAENARKEYPILTKRWRTGSLSDKCMKEQISRDIFTDQKRAVTLLQSVIRGWLVRKHTNNMRNLSGSIFYITSVNKKQEKLTPNSVDAEQDHLQVPPVRELQRQILKVQSALKQKEDENAELQQQLQQFQTRWAEYDARMKSMEETRQKQMTSLQMNLATAKNSLAINDTRVETARPDTSPSPRYYDSEDTMSMGTRSPDVLTPTKLPNITSDATPGREPNGSLNAVSHLFKELEQRKQAFSNDVRFLADVKPGQSALATNSYEEFRRVKKNFETWKKEFKDKLRQTKTTLKREIGEPDRKCKTWWGKRSTRRT